MYHIFGIFIFFLDNHISGGEDKTGNLPKSQSLKSRSQTIVVNKRLTIHRLTLTRIRDETFVFNFGWRDRSRTSSPLSLSFLDCTKKSTRLVTKTPAFFSHIMMCECKITLKQLVNQLNNHDWWAGPDLNRRPSARQADVLPN